MFMATLYKAIDGVINAVHCIFQLGSYTFTNQEIITKSEESFYIIEVLHILIIVRVCVCMSS